MVAATAPCSFQPDVRPVRHTGESGVWSRIRYIGCVLKSVLVLLPVLRARVTDVRTRNGPSFSS
jgi:hypothetical protein